MPTVSFTRALGRFLPAPCATVDGDTVGLSFLDTRFHSSYFTIRLLNLTVFCMLPDRLSTTCAALADPTRRAILAGLTLGEASVTKLAAAMSLPAVPKHSKVLGDGLIARGRKTQWWSCRLERFAEYLSSPWAPAAA
jgi:hypothetical protein